MYNAAEYGQVGLTLFVDSTNKAGGFESCKAVDKIGAVKSFPAFYILL
jgi:hypothetical protein